MKKLVDWFPLGSSALIEASNGGQLYQMWKHHTAAGQNPWSYVSILLALVLWVFYFEHKTGRTLAYWVTWVSVTMIAAIIVTIFILQGAC